MTGRNELMVERIEATPVNSSVRFAVAGDSGAWPDPTADAIFGQLVRQVAGTPDRHERYLELVEPLPFPNLCIVGNHDLDDPAGRSPSRRSLSLPPIPLATRKPA
jgi:hypothetical protein